MATRSAAEAAKTHLLPRDLVVAFAEFSLEASQARDIEPRRRPDLMRQHEGIGRALRFERRAGSNSTRSRI
jgi:hypothetical protein